MANEDGEHLASRKLAALLRADIERGDLYPPGKKLPSYRQLAERYDVAPNTAQAAMRLLEASGLVTIRAKSGAYVRDAGGDLPGRDVRAELTDLLDQLGRTKRELSAAQQTVASLLDRLPVTGE